MKLFKMILFFILITIFLLNNIKNITYASSNSSSQKPVKAAVFLSNVGDVFIYNAQKGLEDIQRKNNNKIEFTFFDSKGNQVIQDEAIAKSLNKNFDLFVVKPVSGNSKEVEDSLNKIMQADIPFIIYLPRTTEPLTDIIKSYGKAVIITEDVKKSGTLQGKILADTWNSNKKALDKNNDNIMQYIMLQGPSNNEATIERTKHAIQALNEAGIQIQPLLSTVCNWNGDCAKTTIESAFLTLGNKIEAIIANNDEMALGAIEALQKYGFNKGDTSKYIPVVGIDGSPNAKKAVNEGIMAGTVVEDLNAQIHAIYSIGMNLAVGTNPLSGTDYKFDETGITIKIPNYEYAKQPSSTADSGAVLF